MKKGMLFKLGVLFLGWVITLVSCTTIFHRPGFEPITPKVSESREWEDDLDFISLEKAVNQSIRYYQRVSQSQVFEYGDIPYSPKEMEASMKLFLEIMRIPNETERFEQLRKKFIFLESKNDK